MTNEEAIAVIENEIQIDVQLCTDKQVDRFQTALYMAISALRSADHFRGVRKMAPLTLEKLREKWEPCDMCCPKCYRCEFYQKYWEEVPEVCRGCKDYSHFVRDNIEERFCSECGRPLTEEAWAELEKRIRGEGMKFKVGAKIVVKDVHCGGNFENGDIVTVVEIGSEDDPNCYGAISPHDGLMWYLYDDEVSAATNADYIRSMTDEELAKEFVLAGEFENRVCFCCEYFKCLRNKDGYCVYKHGRCNMDARLEAYKKWLQQPAEED